MAVRKRGSKRLGRIRVGISGYDYAPWRGAFYPEVLPRRAWLTYAAQSFDSVEINGTFYSLESPATFEKWEKEVSST